MTRKIFITGATSGIGQGIASAFAAQGDRVVATGATAAEVEAAPKHQHIAYRTLDVRDGEAVHSLVDELGELDAAINCAGVIQRGIEHDPEAFARTLDINLTGTMRVCAAARAGLKARSGCIVNTASMLSFFGGGKFERACPCRRGVGEPELQRAGVRRGHRQRPAATAAGGGSAAPSVAPAAPRDLWTGSKITRA